MSDGNSVVSPGCFSSTPLERRRYDFEARFEGTWTCLAGRCAPSRFVWHGAEGAFRGVTQSGPRLIINHNFLARRIGSLALASNQLKRERGARRSAKKTSMTTTDAVAAEAAALLQREASAQVEKQRATVETYAFLNRRPCLPVQEYMREVKDKWEKHHF